MIKTKNITVISMFDFDDLVKVTYGRDYCYQQQDGCKDRGMYNITVPNDEFYDFENDTLPEEVNGNEMGVSFKGWLNRDPKQPLKDSEPCMEDFDRELWWHRNFYPHESMIVNDLYEKGLIEAGEYSIEVDW